MAYLHLFAILSVILLVLCWRGQRGGGEKAAGYIPPLVFGAALLIRLLCACFSKGFNTDISCFAAWAQRMWSVGPRNFYSPEVFTDYPPGFLYYLYLVGGLCDKLRIPAFSAAQLLLLKLPAILCDMGCGALIYREARQRLGQRNACLLAAAYLYQPAVILDSALWGQVDSILTLAVLAMCLMLMKGKLPAAYLAFGLGILLKPQMLVFAPVLLAGILDQVFRKNFSWGNLAYQLLCGLEVIAGMAILCMPFGLGKVVEQYLSTLGEYPYVAVNACNFWGLLGKNWVSQEEKFLFLPYRSWGSIVILAIVFCSFLISLHRKKSADASEEAGKYPLIAAFVIITMFVFSVRMHERYLYPGLAMLLLAYLYLPGEELYLCYGGFSLLSFYNMAWVLYFYDPEHYDRRSPFILAVSLGMLVCAGYLYYLIRCGCRGREPLRLLGNLPAARTSGQMGGGRRAASLPGKKGGASGKSKKARLPGWQDAFLAPGTSRINWIDGVAMAAFTLLYAAFALTDLGDRRAPVTAYDISGGEQITLEFAEPPSEFSYYIAPWQERDFKLRLWTDGGVYWSQDVTLKQVFTWQKIEPEQPFIRMSLSLRSGQVAILELCFRDEQGRVILPLNADRYEALFDEQELCPERSTFRNGMYFDEIYHGRTAYEYLHGMYSYENTHPPLGKIFIALGVAIFGMNPFGWRIMGTLFGILMVPAAYLFGKKLTGSTPGASLTAGLYAFDFMHFVQTRIATIDVYITFFVIWMYFFMYLYVSACLRGGTGRRLLPLGLCGVCMGLGVACKWTGVYAGLGLAVIFFLVLVWQYRNEDRKKFMPRTIRLVGFCLIFFVCIPAAIYLLSYLPFVDGANEGLVRRMLHNQQTMFDYHSKLEATHYFSSLWYQWPIITKPIWYYSGTVSQTVKEGISSFGNPLVWWVGIPALLYMFWRIARHRDGKALFLVIGYMAQYLPWMFISRLTFIYHYFPSVIFVVLMIVYGIQCLTERKKELFLPCCAVYLLLVFGLFLLFYPVLSGAPVESEFVKQWLRWGKEWVLVSG